MTTDLLTADELRAVDLTADLANLMRRIIGDGPTADHDWSEAAAQIHVLQASIMSQAAARAYPDLFRLKGGRVGEPPTVRTTSLARKEARSSPDDVFEDLAALSAPDRDKGFVRETTIALTYTPISPDELFRGCLSSIQAYDGAWRVLTQLIEKGWTIDPPASDLPLDAPIQFDPAIDGNDYPGQ